MKSIRTFIFLKFFFTEMHFADGIIPGQGSIYVNAVVVRSILKHKDPAFPPLFSKL